MNPFSQKHRRKNIHIPIVIVSGFLIIVFALIVFMPSKPNGLVKREKMLIESKFSDCVLEINTVLYTLAAPDSEVFWTDLSEDELIKLILADNKGASIKMIIEKTVNNRYLIDCDSGLFEVISYGEDKEIRKNRYLITDLSVPLMLRTNETPTTIMFPRFLLDVGDLEFFQMQLNKYYPVVMEIETIEELFFFLQQFYSESNWANITAINTHNFSIEFPMGTFEFSLKKTGKSLSIMISEVV